MRTIASLRRPRVAAALGAAIWLVLAAPVAGAPQPAQQTYASAEEAAAALAAAARAHDQARLHAIFGAGGDKLLSSGDHYADEERLRAFAAAYDAKHALVRADNGSMQLEVGDNDWPLPIPIVQADGRWHFDTAAGAQEIIDRRIGRNELAAIRVALTYVEAQQDYFARMKQQTGTGTYAGRLISTPKHQDGLYWPVTGDAESPFGPLVAQAIEEGYAGAFTGTKPIPYQGYFFRVLKAQGSSAPGGAKSYVKAGRMTEGFALLAWPAIYESSGIMSFQVGPDGVVYQKDLGPDSTKIASGITQFDPDLSWARIDITNQ